RVSHPRDMVQHQAPGAFEVLPLALEARQVDEPLHLERQLADDRIEYLLPPLGPAARALEWIEHDRAVLVKAHPVVGEARIGLRRMHRVVDRANAQPFAQECPDELLELRTGDVRRIRDLISLRVLEGIGERGFGIEPEGLRPDHEHRIRALLAGWASRGSWF